MSGFKGDDDQSQESWEETIANYTPASREQADSWADGITETIENAKGIGENVLSLIGDLTGLNQVDDIWTVLTEVIGSDSRTDAIKNVHEASDAGTYNIKIAPPQIPWFSAEFGTVSREKQDVPETIGDNLETVPNYGTRTKIEFSSDVDALEKYVDKVGLGKIADGAPQVGLTIIGDRYMKDTDNDPLTNDFVVDN